MRIIAGTHRGRPLLGPKDAKTTRPITDRVKETLFNRLASLGVLGEGQAVEVFCGTGSLGLEALSRGAGHCTFVDRDRDAVARLKQNLDALGFSDRATVHQASASPTAWALRIPETSVNVAFVDPPFPMVRDAQPDRTEPDGSGQVDTGPAGAPVIPREVQPVFDALRPKLEPGGVLVYRTPAECVAPEVAGYDGPTSFPYGGMALHFYQRPMENEAPEAHEA